MTRTTLTPSSLVEAYPELPVTEDSQDLAFEAADVVNNNQFVCSGNDLILVWNTDAGPQTVTITSVDDHHNRDGDIDGYSVGAGEIAQFRVKSLGWEQTNGYIYLQASDAAVKFAIIPLK